MLNDVIGYMSFEMGIDKKLHNTSIAGEVWYFTLFSLFSMLWGYAFGLVTCIITKYTGSDEEKDQRSGDNFYPYDFAVMFISPWIAYLVAQVMGMSGIIAIFFCGIALGQYAVRNLSRGCRRFTHRAYGSISEICETLCFLYIGVSFYGFNYDFG